MTHEEIKAELSSYALGALDADELATVDQHLAAGCVNCARELSSWREVVGHLALASQQAQAPNLKSRLLGQAGPPQHPATVARSRRLLVPFALAATALLALGIVRGASWQRQAAQQQALIAELQSQLAGTQDQLQHLTVSLAAKEKDVTSLRAALAAADEALALIQQPGLQMVRLKETPDAHRAEGHVLMSSGSRRALFYAFDLPAVPADRTYELWWITEKQGPLNAGIFVPDRRGLGRVETVVPDDAGIIQAAAVTIEPRGGVIKPSGPMVLLGKL